MDGEDRKDVQWSGFKRESAIECVTRLVGDERGVRIDERWTARKVPDIVRLIDWGFASEKRKDDSAREVEKFFRKIINGSNKPLLH